jgi:hypothetical protein
MSVPTNGKERRNFTYRTERISVSADYSVWMKIGTRDISIRMLSIS